MSQELAGLRGFGTRTFSRARQDDFAQLSADTNPIHVDPVAARRSVAGDLVVHGVHTLLWGLDLLAGSPWAPQRVATIDMRFSKPL